MKLTKLVAAFVAVLVLAAPVAAQSEFESALQGTFNAARVGVDGMARNMCANHRGTGDLVEASWCYGLVVSPSSHRVTGYNPNSVFGPGSRFARIGDFYRNPYERGGYAGYGPDFDVNARTLGTIVGGGAGAALTEHRRGWQKAGAIVAGAILGNIVGKKLDERSAERITGEKPSDCVKRTMKEFDKRKASVSTEQVIALCGGGPAPDMAQRTPQSDATPAPSATQAPATVHQKDGYLCNNTEVAVIIYVNGSAVGQLAPGRKVSVADLPTGELTFINKN